MKFGLLFRAQDPPDASNLTRRWQDILEAGQLAEEVGFDGLFLPEHHMMDDGYVPAPLVGLGALAAVTKRVDLGTTIMLLPFYNPVQVAEHAAMVDVISGRADDPRRRRRQLRAGVRALRPHEQGPDEALRGVDHDRPAPLGGRGRRAQAASTST